MKIIPIILMSLSLYAQTASLLPPVKAQFLNDDGTPMVGGKVCTYTAGTTTPQQTYADSALSVANSNPIILDARGEALIWLSSASPYKVVLRRPGGVSAPFATACSDTSQVYSVDNVSSAASGGGGGGGSSLPVDDTTSIVQNVSDNTKQVQISAASISPFQTRILTMPDTNLTVAGRDVANTFTQTQTMGANLVPSSAGSWNVGTNALPFSTFVGVEYYARTNGGLCNYASIAANVISGGTIAAQDAACAVQAQMGANGFDTVNTVGSYRVQGQQVISPDRFLQNIAGVATNLIPTTDGTRDLGSLALKYREIYANQALIDSVIPNTAGSLVGTFAVPYGQGNFENLIAKTTLRVGTSTTAGWILTADASGFASWAAAPTGTLPSQTGNNGKYLTTDGTNASWATVSGSGISSLNGQTGSTQSFTNDTNVTISSAADVHTIVWSGQLAASRGGTGLSAFTRTGNTTQFATWSGATTATRCVETDASGNLTVAAGACGTSGGITTLNGQTGASQTFGTGSSGTDFNISSALNQHFFNIPSASTSARGLITASAQTLGGEKTFNDGAKANYVYPLSSGAGNLGNSANRWVGGHVISMTHQSDGSTLGAVRVRNSASSKLGSIADNGTDIELSINNGSTNFLVNGSNLVFGLTATTLGLTPSVNDTYVIGNGTNNYAAMYSRQLNLRQTASGVASFTMRGLSNNIYGQFSGDDTAGGLFTLYSSGGSNFFSATGGNLYYNGALSQTTTVTIGACVMTFNQGGLTGKTGGC